VAKSKIDLFSTENSDNETSYDEEVGSDETEEITLPTSENSKPKKKKVNSEDEINAFRNRLQIKARGSDIPNPAATFDEMDIFADLKPIIIGNIEESKWKDPTPIQMQAITVMLKGGLSLCVIYPPLNVSYISDNVLSRMLATFSFSLSQLNTCRSSAQVDCFIRFYILYAQIMTEQFYFCRSTTFCSIRCCIFNAVE
jgi:hypothetical protein